MVTPPEHADAYEVSYSGPYPSVELTKGQAISYLCRETLSLPESPTGYLRVTYCGLGLGFVKNIGTRANNLLPTSLRILNRK
jgi:NOL1/NOP2/fmu family ribosome biogenesis protein